MLVGSVGLPLLLRPVMAVAAYDPLLPIFEASMAYGGVVSSERFSS